MGGYKYGVWLLVNEFDITKAIQKYNDLPYLAHITVMCQMSQKDAIQLSNKIHGLYNVIINPESSIGYQFFNGPDTQYKTQVDKLVASGFNCHIENWKKIVKIASQYTGSIPQTPHLSIAYRQNLSWNHLPSQINEIKYSIETRSLTFPVDIRGNYPEKWKIMCVS